MYFFKESVASTSQMKKSTRYRSACPIRPAYQILTLNTRLTVSILLKTTGLGGFVSMALLKMVNRFLSVSPETLVKMFFQFHFIRLYTHVAILMDSP